MRTKVKERSAAVISFLACTVACVGDTTAVYIFGTLYPGYNHLMQPMSALGASGSPVARLASAWWVLIGILFILFAAGYRRVYTSAGPRYKIVSWLIALYGAGEGIGSGIFPGNRIGGHLTPLGIVHITLGVLGVAAIMVLPFVMLGTFSKAQNIVMRYFSLAAAASGIITVLLFNLSNVINAADTVFSYRGLWQRVFVFIYYVYLMVIAYRMLRYSPSVAAHS